MNELLFFIFTYILLTNLILIKTKLVFVYENVRHGLRSPASEYSSLFDNKTLLDEYGTEWDGDGELTTKGKMQHYILGIRNRIKYSDLLDYKKYEPEKLLVHVTNSSRVKESVYNQLNAMFNPIIKLPKNFKKKEYKIPNDTKKFYFPPNYKEWYNQSQKLENKLLLSEAEYTLDFLLNNVSKGKNETFLTKTNFNISVDNELNINFTQYSKGRTFMKRTCANHKAYIDTNQKQNYKKLVKVTLDKKYGKQLQKFFGYKNRDFILGIHRSFSVVDHFIVNYEEERDISNFIDSTNINKEEFYKQCKSIYKWWLFHIYCDRKTCVMESSKLMGDLIKYMDRVIKNNKEPLKMVIDSGHDVTVAPMQLFMKKAFNIQATICDFSCNIYFELHKVEVIGDYFVKYLVDDVSKLQIRYSIFKEKVLQNIWTDKQTKNFCKGNKFKVLYPTAYVFLYVLGLNLLGLFFTFLINKYYYVYASKHGNEIKNNKKKNEKNELLKNNLAVELEHIETEE